MLKKVIAPLALLALTAVALPAQTLEEVLACHQETIGGVDAWKAVDAVKMSGRMTVGPGMEAPFTVLNARPNKVRIDFTFQGMTGTQAYDGETGWMVMPFMGSTEPEEMPAEQVDALKEDSDVDGPFIGYEDEPHTLEFLGTEEVEGTEAYKILVTKENGNTQTYFLDTEYCLPFRVESQREVQGQTIEAVTTIGDYKEVSGLVIAHSVETSSPQMPQAQVMTFDEVIINPDYAPDTFSMPEGEDEGGPGN